mgnify:CR=1 FL=1
MVIKKEPEMADKIFKERLEETEKKYALLRVPFCRPCAQMEFKRVKKNIITETEAKEGYTLEGEDLDSLPELVEEAKKFDFDRYTGEKHFKKTSEVEKRRYDSRTNKMTTAIEGIDVNFVCKPYGHGNTLFMTEDEFASFKAKK